MDETKRLLVSNLQIYGSTISIFAGTMTFSRPIALGPARKNGAAKSNEFEIPLAGLNETVTTDIPTDPNGRPRAFLRGRSWVRRFHEYHNVAAGDRVALERVAEGRYRLSLASPNGNGHAPTAAEFFAGIGLVRLAPEKQGWRVAFANDIDPDKAERYRHISGVAAKSPVTPESPR